MNLYYGNIKNIAKRIDGQSLPLQILAVCGNNARAYGELAEVSFKHPTRIYGFTDKIALLMDAADAVMTKPGGLTASEALAKRLPIILTDGIPGIEARNAELLLNNGVAVRLSETYPEETAIRELFGNPVRLAAINSCIDSVCRPHSTETLCRFIEKCVSEKGKL